jgi:predicted phage baseplate assembly protein
LNSALKGQSDALLTLLKDAFGEGTTTVAPTKDLEVNAWWTDPTSGVFERMQSRTALLDPGLFGIWSIAQRYLDKEAAGVPADTSVAETVQSVLGNLQLVLVETEKADFSRRAFELLSSLQSEQARISPSEYPRVRPWIDAMVDDLGDAIVRLARDTANVPVVPPLDAFNDPINQLVQQLMQRPDGANEPGDLSRQLTDVAQPAAGAALVPLPDILPRLLSQVEERSRPSLLAALAQLEVNPSRQPNNIKVFRAQARPFGVDARPIQLLVDNRPTGEIDWPIEPTQPQFHVHFEIGTFAKDFGLVRTQAKAVLERYEIQAQGARVNVSIGDPANDDLVAGKTLALDDGAGDRAIVTIRRADSAAGVLAIELEYKPLGADSPLTYLIEGQPEGAKSQMVRIRVVGGRWDVALSTSSVAGATTHFSRTQDTEVLEATLINTKGTSPVTGIIVDHTFPAPLPVDRQKILVLDREYKGVVPGGFVVIDRIDSNDAPDIRQVVSVEVGTYSRYGLSTTATQLTLDDAWLDPAERSLSDLRKITVYAQSEPLPLGLEPYDADVAGDSIELDSIYPSLEPGRRLVIRGERTDLPDPGGVLVAESAVVLGARQAIDPNRPGDRLHTLVTLTNSLAYKYKRATVEVFGNVAKATHGETVPDEELGDPAQPVDSGVEGPSALALQQGPLTYVPDSTVPSGAVPALSVEVDGVLWREVPRLAGLAPDARNYVVRVAEDGSTTLLFGDGVEGARPSPEPGAIRATYRKGLGLAGNVQADAITLLVSRPLGVQAVTNPLAATGGVDRDSVDSIRRLAPLAVTTLDRLVGVPDYAAFALSFAGIGKALASRLPPAPGDYRARVVVTVAALGGAPLTSQSDLIATLRAALIRFGDPDVDIVVQPRDLLSVAFVGRVRIDPSLKWSDLRPRIELLLNDRFGPDGRELAQPLWLSEVIAAVQGVAGVVAVAVDGFGRVAGPAEGVALSELNDRLKSIQNADPSSRPQVVVARPIRLDPDQPDGIAAAEQAIFNPLLAGTLILNPWPLPRPNR